MAFVLTKGQRQIGMSIKAQPAVKEGAVMKIFSVHLVIFSLAPIGHFYFSGKPFGVRPSIQHFFSLIKGFLDKFIDCDQTIKQTTPNQNKTKNKL